MHLYGRFSVRAADGEVRFRPLAVAVRPVATIADELAAETHDLGFA